MHIARIAWFAVLVLVAACHGVDEVQATVDARYNITATLPSPYPGEGNLNADPLFDPASPLPRPSALSPAIDSALATLAFPDFDLDEALAYLASDFEGTPRTIQNRQLIAPDRGALEAAP